MSAGDVGRRLLEGIMGKIISRRTAMKLVREGKAEIVRDGVVLMEDKRYQIVNRLDAYRVDHYKL